MKNNENQPFISIVIPARNPGEKLGYTLEAAMAQDYPAFEVVLADDASKTSLTETAARFGCRHVRLESHEGAGMARNAGVRAAKGEAIFFTDSDCVMPPDTLKKAADAYTGDSETVYGGTYSVEPHDGGGFFNRFQAVFVNHSETSNPEPDYVATHAMLISRSTFEHAGGFKEDFMPILEDVEFSHRLRHMGVNMRMIDGLEVSHRFGFNMARSLRNAYRKTRYWSMYSLAARDIFKDSGTASLELKANTVAWSASACLLGVYAYSCRLGYLAAAGALYLAGLLLSRGFIRAMFRAHGPAFGLMGSLYYSLLYPIPIVLGSIRGIAGYLMGEHRAGEHRT